MQIWPLIQWMQEFYGVNIGGMLNQLYKWVWNMQNSVEKNFATCGAI